MAKPTNPLFAPTPYPPARKRPPGRPESEHRIQPITRWTTPNLVRLGVALVGAAVLLVTVTTASLASGGRSQVADVAHAEAPSVKAAGDFLLQVEDMDAQLANALLIGGDTSLKTSRTDSERQYELDRQAADLDLQTATTALAGNPAALDQLHKVVDLFGTYQQYATRALQLDEQSGVKVAGTAPSPVIAAYRSALNALAGDNGYDPNDRTSLVFQARALYQASNTDIESSTSSALDTLDAAEVAALLLGLLLVVVLLAFQWWLSRRFHRTVNRGVLAAVAVTAVFLIAATAGLGDAGSTFDQGKHNGFDSVQSLTDGEAISYDANADESRWLLDPQHASQYSASFLAKATQVADIPARKDGIAGYEDAIDAAVHPADLDTSSAGELSVLIANPLTKDSKLGFELSNITYTGEGDLARGAVAAWNTYLRADGQIRSTTTDDSAARQRAIDLDTDAHTAGTSDQAFNAYSDYLTRLITLNQGQFDDAASSSLGTAGTWSWLPYLFGAAVLGLTVAGAQARLREYR